VCDCEETGILFRYWAIKVDVCKYSIVVVLGNKVIVHSFTNNPQRLNVFETVDNDKGKERKKILFN